jgi:UDP-N-acetylglucosamine 2-epimerase (non-hydrolysing)
MFTFVLGTRPEIIKLAPIVRRCIDRSIPFQIVHTGQHYDHALDGIFFEELKLPDPSINLKAAAATQGAFFGNLIPALEKLWSQKRPSVVIVQGDTNSAFAGAFIAQRLGIPVAHVEAGLRSDDWTMPEEVNRILIDRIADRLYAPTEYHAQRIISEGINKGRVLVTGNTVSDAVSEHLALAKGAALPSGIPIDAPYALLTLHRPALVDDPIRLQKILGVIDMALQKQGITGVFLVHPRTRKNLPGNAFPSIRLHDPIGYFPMLRLLAGARIVITDSGGLQEETALLHVSCVTIRENTERPETVEAGGNRITGFDAPAIERAITDLTTNKPDWKSLYTVEHPSDTILEDLLAHFV